MLSVDLCSLWAGQKTEMIKGIVEATNNIDNYKERRLNKPFNRLLFEELHKDLFQVLFAWTGKTFVGQVKSKKLAFSYNNFFGKLMDLLLFIKHNEKVMDNAEKVFSQKCLFRGTVFRYLGSCFSSNRKTVIPKYNDIYVSWSKNPENSYLESKLYGPITWLKCEISEPYYGIDLDCFGVSRGTETEVVFPTIEECIKEIKVIK